MTVKLNIELRNNKDTVNGDKDRNYEKNFNDQTQYEKNLEWRQERWEQKYTFQWKLDLNKAKKSKLLTTVTNN